MQPAGPMEEITFWRERNAAVGGIFEQLSRPAAQALISLAEAHCSDAHLVHSFKSAFSNLQRVKSDPTPCSSYLCSALLL